MTDEEPTNDQASGALRSDAMKTGPARAPARAMLRATGLDDAAIAAPLVAVVNTWSEVTPCNFHLRELAAPVKQGIRAGGGTPIEFNTIVVTDGITMGTAGMRACLATLRRNELLLVVADRRSNDYQVEFLGHPAWTAHGVATFHLRSGAPIVPMICIRETTHHTIHFEPPIRHQTTGDRTRDTVALLGQINALFGGWIQRHPEQWLWQHDRWRGRHRNQRGGNSG